MAFLGPLLFRKKIFWPAVRMRWQLEEGITVPASRRVPCSKVISLHSQLYLLVMLISYQQLAVFLQLPHQLSHPPVNWSHKLPLSSPWPIVSLAAIKFHITSQASSSVTTCGGHEGWSSHFHPVPPSQGSPQTVPPSFPQSSPPACICRKGRGGFSKLAPRPIQSSIPNIRGCSMQYIRL